MDGEDMRQMQARPCGQVKKDSYEVDATVVGTEGGS
jgi:hypothetical protein